MNNIDNRENMIDTRDIKERIEELESDSKCAYNEYEDSREEDQECLDYDSWYDENKDDELEQLRKLYDECLDCSYETKYGETLIRETYFSDYVEDLCDELGYISKDFPSWIEIDWDATAENVKIDYSIVDFDGVDYYIRSC